MGCCIQERARVKKQTSTNMQQQKFIEQEKPIYIPGITNIIIPGNMINPKDTMENKIPENIENKIPEIEPNKNRENISKIYPEIEPNQNQENQETIPNVYPEIGPEKKPEIIPSTKANYDAMYSCYSLKNLFEKDKGWNYQINAKFKNRFKKKKSEINQDDKICTICLLGDSNKGKTFISTLLTGNKLKCGGDYKTRGINCKLSDFNFNNPGNKKEKFLIFDSGGRSEPLLIEPKEKEKLNDETLKNTVEANNRDLKQSEEFTRNFLINNSKIIIVVVNQLSLSEQLFLYELKTEKKYEELFILHNLYIFKTRREIEDYINNTLINAIYFDITKGYFETLDENEKFKPYYFKEEQNDGNEEALIAHLILGDFDSEDEWIKHFNKRTLDFLKDKMQVCIPEDYFNVRTQLQKELRDTNKIGDKSLLVEENIEKTKDEEKGVLKVANERKIEIHGTGNYVPGTEFTISKYTPDYIFYKDQEKFVIEVECAGLYDNNIIIEGKTRKGISYFKIKGEKKYPPELNKENKPFIIDFSVNTEKENIIIDTGAEINKKKPTHENGIYKKIFPIIKEECNENNDLIESTDN